MSLYRKRGPLKTRYTHTGSVQFCSSNGLDEGDDWASAFVLDHRQRFRQTGKVRCAAAQSRILRAVAIRLLHYVQPIRVSLRVVKGLLAMKLHRRFTHPTPVVIA